MAPLTKKTVTTDTRHISAVRVVVHTQNGTPQWSDNHWSMYLLFENGEGSVRINMTSNNFDDTQGNLIWTEHAYSMSNSAIKAWDLKFRDGLSVQHISALIYSKRFECYKMSGGGSGCRYWIWTVLNAIADYNGQNWIKPTDLKEWGPNMQYRYHKTKAPQVSEMLEGEFF